MSSPNNIYPSVDLRLAVLVLLSAMLGAGIWYWDKHIRDKGVDGEQEPIVVNVEDPDSADDSDVDGAVTEADVGGTNAPNGIVVVNVATNPGLSSIRFPEDPFDEPDKVESFDAYVTEDGIVLEWVSGAEDDSLGYRIFRIDSDGEETLVADMTTATAGDGELYKIIEPGQTGGRFVIDRLNADLSTDRLPLNATARLLAPPEEGLNILMIQAEDGEAELDIGTEARNLFIIGFRDKPVVQDLTDPDAPRVLVGETISLSGEQAVYFKAAAYATISVRD